MASRKREKKRGEKEVFLRKRSMRSIPTGEDWYPNCPDNMVDASVSCTRHPKSYNPKRITYVSISFWGADDHGLERYWEFDDWDVGVEKYYHLIRWMNGIAIAQMRGLYDVGFMGA